MGLPTGKARILDLYKTARIQEIQEAAIEMEWNGFAIDPDYFRTQAATAQGHADQQYATLRDLLEAAGVGSSEPGVIWSSPKQLAGLLHEWLGLPRSPFWFKGRVKDGETKLDRVALEWILGWIESQATAAPTGGAATDGRTGTAGGASPHPASRQIVSGVMSLRRILSSLKYLEKLPRYIGPDGFVHPVCGPAGDEDDRVGAITGRFGMKNPEGQQIPRDKRKDIYHIRRGFVAPPGQVLVVRDYTALEVVLLANICEWLFGDTLLLELTAPGQDIHAYNAYNVFGRLLKWRTTDGRNLEDESDLAKYKSDPELAWYRDEIKKLWYKLQYGGTVHGFATSVKGRDGLPIGKQRAGEILEALYEAVPSIPKWQDFVRGILTRDGGISAMDGRFVDYSNLIESGKSGWRYERTGENWGLESACRKGDNFPLQAGGARVIGGAMADAVADPGLRRLGAKLELQVHDELRWRVDFEHAIEVSHRADEIMRAAYPLKNLRTEGGIGLTWEDAK